MSNTVIEHSEDGDLVTVEDIFDFIDRVENDERVEDGRRYFCNDGDPDEDFDDIIFLRYSFTATILSLVLMLEYLNLNDKASILKSAVIDVYKKADCLTPDQGGNSSTKEFCFEICKSIEKFSNGN